MIVSSVSSYVTEQIKEAANNLTDDSEEVVDVIAVDISFVCDGVEIQPEDGSVRVNMRAERTVEGDNHKVVHFDGSDAEIVADASANSASLDASCFSVYAIIGSEYQDEEVKKEARYFYMFYVGNTHVDTQIIKNGDTLLEPSVPELGENKEFTGWRIRGETEDMTFGNVITVEEGEDKYIYVDAHFEDFFKVTFYTSDDKSSILQIITVKDGETVSTKDQILVNDDIHMFDGWYNAEDESKEKVEKVTVSGKDVELLPIFKEGIWVRFNTNGGSYTEPVFIMQNETVKEPEAPERVGYTFLGWYTSNTLTTKFDFSKSVTEATTIYAGWKADVVKYRVVVWTENKDNNEYTVNQILDRTASAGTKLTASMFSNIVVKEKDIACFDIDTKKTNAEECIVKGDGTTTYNVYFSRHRFTIAFWNSNQTVKYFTLSDIKYGENIISKYRDKMKTYGGSIDEGSGGWIRANISSNKTSDMDILNNNTFNFTVTSASLYRTNLLPYKNNSKEVIFKRYTISSNNKYTYYVYLEYLDDETTPEGAEIIEEGGIKYYLRNVATTFSTTTTMKMNFNSNGQAVIKLVKNRETGAVNQLAYINGQLVTTLQPNVEYNFYYMRDSNKLKFDDSSLKSYALKYEEKLADYEPEGYVIDETLKEADGKTYIFKGWTTSEGESVDFSTARMPKTDLMLYAKWEDATARYKVTFNYYNGEPKDSVIVMSGDTVERPADPEKDGYRFVGWKTSTGTVFDFHSKIYEDTELIATWMNEKTYTVKYDAGEFGSFTKQDLNNYLDGARAIIVGVPTITDISKKFIGWKIGNNSKLYKTGTFAINEDDADENGVITLVAQYEDGSKIVTITYDPNGHNGKVVTFEAAPMNNDITFTKSPSDADVNFVAKPYYEFVKWNTEADGSGESFYPREVIAINNTDGKAAILYAQWRGVDDVLTYKANGGTGTMEDTDGKVYETIKVSENKFIRLGYTFTGWNTKADGTGDSYEEGSDYTLTPENDTLYAQWKENQKEGMEEDTNNDSKDDFENDSKDNYEDDFEKKPEEQNTQCDAIVQVEYVSNEVSNSNNEKKDYPRTGEERNIIPVVMLILGLLGLVTHHFIKKRKEEEL